MSRLREIAAAALAVASVAAFADWYCPVLNRSFDFPFGWPEGSSSPPLTMDSKYAKVATDAGLEYYRRWMKWNGSYAPTNQQALVSRTLSDKLLPRDFVAGTFGKFGSLVNDDYHAVYGSGEMTNEVLAFAYNTEIDYDDQGGGASYVVDDLRRVPASYLFPGIGGEQSRSPADAAVSNAIHSVLGLDATAMTPFYYNGYSVDLATILYAWDYMLSWSLAMDYRQLDPPECLQAGSFYPIVSDPWRSYLRHYHYTGNDIPHMLFRCRGRTPFSYSERVDWQISSTYYYCELTTNADATATLKLNYVLFEHTTSNAYSLTRPLFYGERVTGEAQAEGTAYGVALSGLRTEKTCITDGEFWRDVYIPSTGETKHCCITPCVYKIAEERSFGTKLDYLYRLKKYAIAKRANYENVGFPAATSAYDWSNVWTLYQYDSDGSDYYGNPATYSGKGIESSGTVATNDPYYVDHYFNSQAFDSDIYNISEALHPSVDIEVYYDQSDPEFTLGPFTVPNHPDMCIVTSNHRDDPDHPGVRIVDMEGWMYTNDWNFVEDPGAAWIGAGPTMVEVVYPQYYEKDGDAIYELFPWQLPFTFAVDMFSQWVSNRWGMWE